MPTLLCVLGSQLAAETLLYCGQTLRVPAWQSIVNEGFKNPMKREANACGVGDLPLVSSGGLEDVT
jgi:hypothetical protein